MTTQNFCFRCEHSSLQHGEDWRCNVAGCECNQFTDFPSGQRLKFRGLAKGDASRRRRHGTFGLTDPNAVNRINARQPIKIRRIEESAEGNG